MSNEQPENKIENPKVVVGLVLSEDIWRSVRGKIEEKFSPEEVAIIDDSAALEIIHDKVRGNEFVYPRRISLSVIQSKQKEVIEFIQRLHEIYQSPIDMTYLAP